MGSDASNAKKEGLISHQRLKINRRQCYVFLTQIEIFFVIFAILVGHIKLEKSTENAGLQSHTKTLAGDQYISICKILHKIEDVRVTGKTSTKPP